MTLDELVNTIMLMFEPSNDKDLPTTLKHFLSETELQHSGAYPGLYVSTEVYNKNITLFRSLEVMGYIKVVKRHHDQGILCAVKGPNIEDGDEDQC